MKSSGLGGLHHLGLRQDARQQHRQAPHHVGAQVEQGPEEVQVLARGAAPGAERLKGSQSRHIDRNKI